MVTWPPVTGRAWTSRNLPDGGNAGWSHAGLGEQLLHVAVRQANRRYQRTACTIAAGRNESRRRRNPAQEQGERVGFSCQQPRCSDTVTANATVPYQGL